MGTKHPMPFFRFLEDVLVIIHSIENKYRQQLAEHNELGKLGEQLAANFLRANGYTIIERNWRVNRAEIDLIVRKDKILVFVEVKSRSTAHFGPPEAFVTKRKKRLMASAASAYMHASGHEWAIRFDIISVLMQLGKSPVIEHFEDAFFPGLFE